MPKYEVTRYVTVRKVYQVTVDAEHPDDAREMYWDDEPATPVTSKVSDSDMFVREVK